METCTTSSKPYQTLPEYIAADARRARGIAASVTKRRFDIVMAACGLVFLAPAFGLIGLCIKLDSSGPIFHRGQRTGKDGALFRILKFRTMVATPNPTRPPITFARDPRVTRIGQFLRWTKLDELPQLVNVLRGEMSLVGPRPEDPCYVSLYTDAQRRVLTVRPGITSLASVTFRHESRLLESGAWESVYIHQILPKKLALDIEYLDRITLWQDIRVIWLTVRTLYVWNKSDAAIGGQPRARDRTR
jgi:lipopolysaccharide/colanic/teichoic acid biosynthesis glycosyltransferase